MTKSTLMITVCASLLWAGTALATPTPQQSCDSARITAWKTYVSCVDGLLAKHAKGVLFTYNNYAPFAKCRHTYFKKWTAFQTKAALAGSTCQPIGGARFIDNGNQTVTDNLTTLVWEKKDKLGGIHDQTNSYTWSISTPYAESGTAFTGFLATLNGGGGFAGSNGWRLPTLMELQTIVLDFSCRGTGYGPNCNCLVEPCIDPAIGIAIGAFYWSNTSYISSPDLAWLVRFDDGGADLYGKINYSLVRAVRGGL